MRVNFKFKIAEKEWGETDYWLDICRHSDCIPEPRGKLFKDKETIRKMVGKILATSCRKKKDQQNRK